MTSSHAYTDDGDEIRELIADETPMRRAYEVGLRDGAKLAEARIAQLEAAVIDALDAADDMAALPIGGWRNDFLKDHGMEPEK